MRLAVGLSVIALGLILLMVGVNSSNTIALDFSRFLTGSPSEWAVWMLLAGLAAVAVGLYAALTTPGVLKKH